MNEIWRQPAEDLEFQEGVVHVWRFFLARDQGLLVRQETLLSADERKKAERFRFARDRAAYIVSHAALREILSRYTGGSPPDIGFRHTPHGKPFLAESDVFFNLSHSGEIALVAVARNRRIGVDLERVRFDLNVDPIAEDFFSSNDTAALKTRSDRERVSAFFECWTRKEALLKALGGGVSMPLEGVDVFQNMEGPQVVHAPTDFGGIWTLKGFSPAEGYTAAVATEGTGVRYCFFVQ